MAGYPVIKVYGGCGASGSSKNGRKSLYTRLCPEHMGRDKFLIWYQENGYSVHPQKTGAVQLTAAEWYDLII